MFKISTKKKKMDFFVVLMDVIINLLKNQVDFVTNITEESFEEIVKESEENNKDIPF